MEFHLAFMYNTLWYITGWCLQFKWHYAYNITDDTHVVIDWAQLTTQESCTEKSNSLESMYMLLHHWCKTLHDIHKLLLVAWGPNGLHTDT